MSAFCHVVTGASSGIGECVARALLGRGERTVVVARGADRLKALYGADPNAVVVPADLAEPEALEKLVPSLKDPVRFFVHCAGFASPAPLGYIDESVARRLFAVHALFPLRFLGWMARAVHHADGASAVLVSSRSAHEADRGNAAYAAAKGAVEGLFPTAKSELADRGVRLSLIAPGPVETDMARATWMRDATEEAIDSMRRTGELVPPERIADEILALLEGGE